MTYAKRKQSASRAVTARHQERARHDSRSKKRTEPVRERPARELVRVVIPAFRASGLLREVVTAVLHSQRSFDLEVVVVDDGGNEDLGSNLSGLAVSLVHTGGSGSAAIARNFGAAGFEGKYLVFIDSDVLVHQDCIETLLRPLRRGRAEATVGNYSKNVAGLPFAARYKQLYISKIYQRQKGYLQNEFWTAIGAVDASVFHRLHGFDPAFTGAGGEDTDLGRRLTNGGFRILAAPGALGDHRHSLSVAKLLRNDWRKGLLAMGNYFDSEGSLSHNRHATRRDMLAALLATLTLATPIAGALGLPLMATLSVLAALLGGYFLSRLDLLRAFSSQGAVFVACACGLVYVLDVMRSACFATGSGLRLLSRLRDRAGSEPQSSGRARLATSDASRDDQEFLQSHLPV